ncbi:transcriptional regulator, AraC family [Coraliomargarita akajimensis DSM 45221]|uniref:Transcriptional regulator, AraC family n=2 Tax=Coraliomargarita TaxID=442430 RepID=D5EQM4_CORAD|nr:transcriptional regulator, AraC family [Coraliomargarita akajimensis DSM 45221]
MTGSHYRLGVITHPDWQSGRDIARGCQQYYAGQAAYQIRILPYDSVRDDAELRQFDGFLIEHFSTKRAELFRGRPVVYLDYLFPPVDSHSIIIDNQQAGALAADHLSQTGARYFAYCDFAYSKKDQSEDREGVNRTQIRFRGFSRQLVEQRLIQSTDEVHRHSLSNYSRLRYWLEGLPKPIAVYCNNDHIALHITQIAKLLRIQLRKELFVLGTDNDSTLCELSEPRLSSIDMGFEQLGYEAAKLLDQLAKGQAIHNINYTLAPKSIVERRSSTPLNSNSPTKELYVGDLNQACAQLRLNERAISEIAVQAGFSSYPQFLRQFKAHTGLTPSSYRKHHQ